MKEIGDIIEDYRRAAANAMLAGFDGVEIHAANGYLIQQFLSDHSNQRSDLYGGSVENRIRFALEIVKAVSEEIGGNATGIRLSPVTPSNDARDSSPASIYFPLVCQLNQFKLAYIHVIEGSTGGERDFQGFDYHGLRKEFKGSWIVNNGYDLELANKAVSSGYADLVAFGRLYISNPDLAERFRTHSRLNEFDKSTFYGGNDKGYTDYPQLEQS